MITGILRYSSAPWATVKRFQSKKTESSFGPKLDSLNHK